MLRLPQLSQMFPSLQFIKNSAAVGFNWHNLSQVVLSFTLIILQIMLKTQVEEFNLQLVGTIFNIGGSVQWLREPKALKHGE